MVAIVLRVSALAAKLVIIFVICGAVVGSSSCHSVVKLNTATMGAASVLTLLPSLMCATRRSRADGERTHIMRIGWMFMAVGPILVRA